MSSDWTFICNVQIMLNATCHVGWKFGNFPPALGVGPPGWAGNQVRETITFPPNIVKGNEAELLKWAVYIENMRLQEKSRRNLWRT